MIDVGEAIDNSPVQPLHYGNLRLVPRLGMIMDGFDGPGSRLCRAIHHPGMEDRASAASGRCSAQSNLACSWGQALVHDARRQDLVGGPC